MLKQKGGFVTQDPAFQVAILGRFGATVLSSHTCRPWLCSRQRFGPPACRQTDQNTGSPGEEKAGNVTGVCPTLLEKLQQLKRAVGWDCLKVWEGTRCFEGKKKKKDSVAEYVWEVWSLALKVLNQAQRRQDSKSCWRIAVPTGHLVAVTRYLSTSGNYTHQFPHLLIDFLFFSSPFILFLPCFAKKEVDGH